MVLCSRLYVTVQNVATDTHESGSPPSCFAKWIIIQCIITFYEFCALLVRFIFVLFKDIVLTNCATNGFITRRSLGIVMLVFVCLSYMNMNVLLF